MSKETYDRLKRLAGHYSEKLNLAIAPMTLAAAILELAVEEVFDADTASDE